MDLTDASNDSKLSVLKTIFGHDSFRGKQEEAINAILDGKNCLILIFVFLLHTYSQECLCSCLFYYFLLCILPTDW